MLFLGAWFVQNVQQLKRPALVLSNYFKGFSYLTKVVYAHTYQNKVIIWNKSMIQSLTYITLPLPERTWPTKTGDIKFLSQLHKFILPRIIEQFKSIFFYWIYIITLLAFSKMLA